jgi:hypothetical protein
MKPEISIEQYEVAEGTVSLGGIKWQQRWDVKITFDDRGEAYALRERLEQPAAWVGLTDKEAMQICEDCGCLSEDWLVLLDAVEAKLREKNGGSSAP